MTPELRIEQNNHGLIVPVKVVPGSSRTAIVGLYDGALKIKIAAAPEKGKANKELTAFLAKTLNLPKSHVTIIAGHHNAQKQIQLEKITPPQLHAILKPLLT